MDELTRQYVTFVLAHSGGPDLEAIAAKSGDAHSDDAKDAISDASS